MSVPALLQALQNLLQEMPRHLAMEGYKYLSEVREKRKTEQIAAATTTMAAFLDAVHIGRYEAAASLCSPGLQEVMLKKGGHTKRLEIVRAHLIGTLDESLTDPPALNFLGTSCHLSGVIRYTENRSAHFTLDVVKQQSKWKVNEWNFDAVPAPVLATLVSSGLLISSRKVPVYKTGKPTTKTGRCPKGYPIKGSAKNIYHLRGGRFYATTSPVRCFATEDEAKVSGFRPSQR
jgi:hypothetical protein